MNLFSEIISKLIKEYRDSLNLSLRDMGEKLNVSQTTIDNIEKKKFSFSLDSLYKLSKFFNKTFIIVPNEPIKMFNAFQDIELQNSEYEKEFLDFLRDPDNELILRLAKVIKDTNSLDNFAVKTIFEQYKKKS